MYIAIASSAAVTTTVVILMPAMAPGFKPLVLVALVRPAVEVDALVAKEVEDQDVVEVDNESAAPVPLLVTVRIREGGFELVIEVEDLARHVPANAQYCQLAQQIGPHAI